MCTTHWRINGSIGDVSWSIYRQRAWSGWSNTFTLIFQVFKLLQAFTKLSLSFFLLNRTFTDSIHSFSIYKIASSWPSSKFTIYTFPVLFEIRLYVLQSVKSWHLTWFFLGRCLTTWCTRLSVLRDFVCNCLILGYVLVSFNNLGVLWPVLWIISLISFHISSMRVMGRVLAIITKNIRKLSKKNWKTIN